MPDSSQGKTRTTHLPPCSFFWHCEAPWRRCPLTSGQNVLGLVLFGQWIGVRSISTEIHVLFRPQKKRGSGRLSLLPFLGAGPGSGGSFSKTSWQSTSLVYLCAYTIIHRHLAICFAHIFVVFATVSEATVWNHTYLEITWNNQPYIQPHKSQNNSYWNTWNPDKRQ